MYNKAGSVSLNSKGISFQVNPPILVTLFVNLQGVYSEVKKDITEPLVQKLFRTSMCTCDVIKFHCLFVQLLHINSYSQTNSLTQAREVAPACEAS